MEQFSKQNVSEVKKNITGKKSQVCQIVDKNKRKGDVFVVSTTKENFRRTQYIIFPVQDQNIKKQ